MKKIIALASASFIISMYQISAGAFTFFETKGWIGNGHKEEYEIGFDKNIKHKGHKSIYIKSKIPEIKSDFSTILQRISSENYIGHRIRFSGYVKTENAEVASLWMRVDDTKGKTLQFDNMNNRSIKGTTDWKKYEVVLDVSKFSHEIFFGGFLAGTGKVWFDDFNLEIVGKDVPSTNMIEENVDKKHSHTKTHFENMDFEE